MSHRGRSLWTRIWTEVGGVSSSKFYWIFPFKVLKLKFEYEGDQLRIMHQCFPLSFHSTRYVPVNVDERAPSLFWGPCDEGHGCMPACIICIMYHLQVCISFNPGGPLKFLPTQRVFHSMRLFQPLWLLNRWAMIQKGKECKRGCACCWVVFKKNLRLLCIHAERQEASPITLPTFLFYLSGFRLPLCDLSSPPRLINICFPLISPV